MLKLIDDFLNRITMYRLILYYLIGLIVVAVVLGFFGKLPHSPISLLYSTLFITILCWLANTLYSWVFDAHTNVESVYITALILVLIITPIKSIDLQYFGFVAWAAAWSMGSKYILAIGRKHVFNPAAFAVALTAITINQSASWWVGTLWMLPFVLIGGLLIVRKIKRFVLVLSFLVSAVIIALGFSILKGENIISSLQRLLVNSPLLFFAFVMLTEPLTTPPTKTLRMYYGAFVGFLFAPQLHLFSVYSTPELSLLVGNIFSYLVSPKQKLMLELQQKIQLVPSVYDFIFATKQKLKFLPGQYLEWTLAHESPDSRGNRRYFTIASSPTEDEIIMGVKMYQPASSFKQALTALEPGNKIVASQLAGDFTLPKDANQKLVFIAGGIGITPFRSMIKYLIDKNEHRDIVLFYSNRTTQDIVYTEVFDQALEQLGIKTIYTVTNEDPASPWQGRRGFITEKIIKEDAPDYADRLFYISGPRSMIVTFEKVLSDMGVPNTNIKTDFFPGFV